MSKMEYISKKKLSEVDGFITWTDKKLRDIGLPKWPGMVIHGDPIKEEQAAEILIRTDCTFPNFEYAGNDRELRKELNGLLNIPERDINDKDWQTHYNAIQKLSEKYGMLNLSYLVNSRIVSSYIGGPHGWCNWNGMIGCSEYNIGKWPDVETVANEWAQIASVFPFLKLKCVLWSGETCEDNIEPLIEYQIDKGKVKVVNADIDSIPRPSSFNSSNLVASLMMPSRNRESGIETRQLKSWLVKIWGTRYPKYRRNKQFTAQERWKKILMNK